MNNRFVIFLLLVLSVTRVSAGCIDAVGEQAVVDCNRELARDPRDFGVRMALIKALEKLERKTEALKIIDEGLALFAADQGRKTILEERRFILQRNRQSGSGSDPVLKVKVLKCKSLTGARALSACDEGLKSYPQNLELLAGRGDALLEISPADPVAALLSYRKAQKLDPSDPALKKKISRAEAAREDLVSTCMSRGGMTALAACDRGLLKGGRDEADIHIRRGELLLDMNRKDSALSAYRKALRLAPGNTRVEDAIAELTYEAPVPEMPPKPAPSTVAEKTTAEPVDPPPVPVEPPVMPPAASRTYSNAPILTGITY